MEPRHRYIVVEGPIGVGKTSLTRALSKRFNARSVFELVEENPFLASFYQDRNKHAFQTQLFFLLSRFKQQQELFQQELFSQVTVSDYLFAKDRIFASITLDPNELALYERVYEHLGPRVMKPDLVIYLQARLDVLLARIRKRGREFERKFDPEYLAELAASDDRIVADVAAEIGEARGELVEGFGDGGGATVHSWGAVGEAAEGGGDFDGYWHF